MAGCWPSSFFCVKINKSTLFTEGDTQQCSLTDKLVALEFPIELEFRNVGFEEGGKPENPEKNPRSKGENQKTNSTYDAGSGNRTRDTLVGGERSRHCATTAPLRVYGPRRSRGPS